MKKVSINEIKYCTKVSIKIEMYEHVIGNETNPRGKLQRCRRVVVSHTFRRILHNRKQNSVKYDEMCVKRQRDDNAA